MPDLETRIAAWRETMAAELPAETVRELEAHLREHIAAQCAEGAGAEVAFARAAARLGDTKALAREFARVWSGWLPASRPVFAMLVLTAGLIVTMGVLLTYTYAVGKFPLLLFSHVLLVMTGYLGMVGTALTGLCALASGQRRNLSERERRELHNILLGMTLLSCLTLPPGVVLGMFWADAHGGAAWAWRPVEIGALTIAFAAFFQLAALWRGFGSDSTRYVLAVLGGGAVAVGWGMAKAPIGDIWPLVWSCLAVALAQVAVLFLRLAQKRNDTANLN